VLDSGEKDNSQADSFQTPPLHKQEVHDDSLASPVTLGEVALESRKSLAEIQQNNETKVAEEETGIETQKKENTAPVMESAAAQ